MTEKEMFLCHNTACHVPFAWQPDITFNDRTPFLSNTALQFTVTGALPAHANFAVESACLMADNIRNEVVTIHRSQVVFKMLSSLHADFFFFFAINCFVKNKVHRSFLHLQHTRHQLSLEGFSSCVILALDFDTPVF
jgi:hypothetical protein